MFPQTGSDPARRNKPSFTPKVRVAIVGNFKNNPHLFALLPQRQRDMAKNHDSLSSNLR